jgi:hypothetical protein
MESFASHPQPVTSSQPPLEVMSTPGGRGAQRMTPASNRKLPSSTTMKRLPFAQQPLSLHKLRHGSVSAGRTLGSPSQAVAAED